MPFKGTCPVEERIAMFRDWDSGAFTVAELTRLFGVSRETFYVWNRRRESGCERWFEELPRAPENRPHTTPKDRIAAIVSMRERFPRFGAKKIRAKLIEAHPTVDWPAPSTIGDILKRAGLIMPQQRRRRPVPVGEIVKSAEAANDEWSIDFKGWFRTQDGTRCDPLTVEDTASRYLLETRIMAQTCADVRKALERLFAECGLPGAIRSDNGSPFGSSGAGGLSQLSVWWLKLGIEPRYIPPASPQHNGGHERMHRTLQEGTTQPPAATKKAQQKRFDDFRKHYNEDRPHEALDQTPPAKHWRPSKRQLPRRIDEPWYDASHEVRRVRPPGTIKWRGEQVFVGEALAGEVVGLAELENGSQIVRFCTHDLGVIGRDLRFLRFAPPRARLRVAKETQ
jgi:transposase InsO family protein